MDDANYARVLRNVRAACLRAFAYRLESGFFNRLMLCADLGWSTRKLDRLLWGNGDIKLRDLAEFAHGLGLEARIGFVDAKADALIANPAPQPAEPERAPEGEA